MPHLTISKIILRGAFSRFATRLYPFVKREPYANTRGHVENEIALCIFCSLCQKKCPTRAITVKKTEKIWEIDRMKCIQCGACLEACPKKCLSMARTYAPAAFTKDIESFHQETKAATADTGHSN